MRKGRKGICRKRAINAGTEAWHSHSNKDFTALINGGIWF